MKRKLTIEFDYCEANPHVELRDKNIIYVEAPKVLLPGIFYLINELIVINQIGSVENAIEHINSRVKKMIEESL